VTAPLDPVIAKIIPLLPLRDPETMTPQGARDALRALAAARAAIPPPPVQSADDTNVMGAVTPLAARVYRVSREQAPTVVFFHGGGWVAGDLEPMTGRPSAGDRNRRRRGLRRLPASAGNALSRRL